MEFIQSLAPSTVLYLCMHNSIYNLVVIVALVGLLILFILVTINNLSPPTVRA